MGTVLDREQLHAAWHRGKRSFSAMAWSHLDCGWTHQMSKTLFKSHRHHQSIAPLACSANQPLASRALPKCLSLRVAFVQRIPQLHVDAQEMTEKQHSLSVGPAPRDCASAIVDVGLFFLCLTERASRTWLSRVDSSGQLSPSCQSHGIGLFVLPVDSMPLHLPMDPKNLSWCLLSL